MGRATPRSRWDALPLELRRQTLAHAGLLTRFLCGLWAPASPAAVGALWAEALLLDWAGDLHALPDVDLCRSVAACDVFDGSGAFDGSDGSNTSNTSNAAHGRCLPLMLGVRSRSMFHRLCARFPLQSDTHPAQLFALTDWIASQCVAGNTAAVAHLAVHHHTPPLPDMRRRLLNIAMRHCWIDLLDLRTAPALVAYAIACGHAELLRQLTSERRLVDLRSVQWVPFIASTDAQPGAVSSSSSSSSISSNSSNTNTTISLHRPMDLAASLGHVGVLAVLHEAGSTACSSHAMDYASLHGRLDVVQWLHAHRSEGCTTNAMDHAASRGHLDVVQWLHANRTEGCTQRAMNVAASSGHLAVVQWLHTHRTEGCTTAAVNWAAKNGHVDVVQFLLAHRSEGFTLAAIEGAGSAATRTATAAATKSKQHDRLVAQLVQSLVGTLSDEQRAEMLQDAMDSGSVVAQQRLESA